MNRTDAKRILSDMPESASAVASRTVDYVRQGWMQDEMIGTRSDDDSAGQRVTCYCLLGALRQASQNSAVGPDPDSELYQALAIDLYGYLRRSDAEFRHEYEEADEPLYGVTLWNDESGRTKAEVVAKAEKWAKRFK